MIHHRGTHRKRIVTLAAATMLALTTLTTLQAGATPPPAGEGRTEPAADGRDHADGEARVATRASADARAWPSRRNTGPRTSPKRTRGDVTSRRDGQLIADIAVNGQVTIQHDDVTVRDVTIYGDSTYMLYVTEKRDGSCPTGVRIEHTEIDGTNAAEDDIPIYFDCGAVFDRGYVHDVGRTSRLTDNGTVRNSWIMSNRTGDSGAHRGAVGTNGGSNNKIVGNVLMCKGVGCSAAIPMYGDFAPVNGMLVKRNLMATTGGYCAYGGSVSSKPYPDGSNVRFIDNHFSKRFFGTCGKYGTVASFDNGVRGNEWSGNVWHESGRPVRAPR